MIRASNHRVEVMQEPSYLANTRIDAYVEPSIIPWAVMSLRELERWLTLPAGKAVDAHLSWVIASGERGLSPPRRETST
jgi:hypothetical protein